MKRQPTTSAKLMNLTALLRCATIFAGGLFATVAVAQQTQYSHGDPTSLEQQMLELVNRARMNPNQEGTILDSVNTWYSVDARARKPSFFANLRGEFAAYPAVAPLAFNAKLMQAARAHSQDMITRNFFGHVNPSGQDPTARGTAAGYDVGVGENIDGGGASSADDVLMSHFGFMVDYDNLDTSNPIGHRLNTLDSTFSEIGIGIAGPRYGGKLTQDFGAPARSYILGVAYNDANANGSYDAGEGMAGITVTPDTGNWFAITSTSGGFAIPVDPVQTVTGTLNVPFPVQGNTWAAVQPYDATYRQQQVAAAPAITVNLTWSGGSLSAPKTTAVTMKRPVLNNYRIVGTDGWYYTMSMVTALNTKADLNPAAGAILPPTISRPLRDFKGDGSPNFIFQNAVGQLYAWFLDGTGSTVNFGTGGGLKPGSKFIFPNGLGDWKLAGVADLNGDGIADLVFQNGAGQVYAWFLDGTGNTVDFGTRSGTKGSGYIYGGGLPGWQLAGVSDVNGDGIPDLVFQNTGTGQVYAWFLDGSGNTVDFSTGRGLKGSGFLYGGNLAGWQLAGISDVNGDGIPDLVFQNTGSGQVYAFFLNGTGAPVNFTTGSGLKPGSKFLYSNGLGDWRLVGVGDLSGDGLADLIFQNGAGQIYAWFLDGSGNTVNFGTGTGLKPGSKFIYSGGLGDWRFR